MFNHNFIINNLHLGYLIYKIYFIRYTEKPKTSVSACLCVYLDINKMKMKKT